MLKGRKSSFPQLFKISYLAIGAINHFGADDICDDCLGERRIPRTVSKIRLLPRLGKGEFPSLVQEKSGLESGAVQRMLRS